MKCTPNTQTDFTSVQSLIFVHRISQSNTLVVILDALLLQLLAFDKYDGEFVTFHYTRHEDNKTITECIPALDFIKRLIVHIPEKHFKMLRYYGIYAKHHKQEKKLHKCISSEKKRYLRTLLNWRHSILLSFGYDPLKCPKCGTSMLVLEVYHKKTALFEPFRSHGIWISP